MHDDRARIPQLAAAGIKDLLLLRSRRSVFLHRNRLSTETQENVGQLLGIFAYMCKGNSTLLCGCTGGQLTAIADVFTVPNII